MSPAEIPEPIEAALHYYHQRASCNAKKGETGHLFEYTDDHGAALDFEVEYSSR